MDFNIDTTDLFSFLIGLLIMLFSAKFTFQKQIDKLKLDFTKEIEPVKTKLEDLEKKVDIHNNIVQKTYKNEADIEAIKKQVK